MSPFHVTAAVAIVATALALTRISAVNALLYLIVSLLAAAVAFLQLAAPFAAALEALVYAGAIIVLFVFVILMFDFAHWSAGEEQRWLRGGGWAGPAALTLVLAAELAALLAGGAPAPAAAPAALAPKQVGATLFGAYLVAVELVSLLLVAGLVGAYHVGRRAVAGRRGGTP
ncbi:MAG TPA: NADH-quinone oxidoreductase subunit J [bacterium]